MENKLINNKLGQHMAEYLILFLAVSIAFVGVWLYLRRGVNAKLKIVQDQLNEAMETRDGIEGLPAMPIKWNGEHINITGQSDDVDCGSAEDVKLTEAQYAYLDCAQRMWLDKGCRACYSAEAFCKNLGICINPACHNKEISIGVWLGGSGEGAGWADFGICAGSGKAEGNCKPCPGYTESDGYGPWHSGSCTPYCPG